MVEKRFLDYTGVVKLFEIIKTNFYDKNTIDKKFGDENNSSSIWVGSQLEYDELDKENNTLYFIIEE